MVMHPMGLIFGFGFVSVLLVVAGVVLLVLCAVRPHALSPTSSLPSAPMALWTGQVGTRETPLDILARRFASGEITAEEFERGRDLLGGGKT